MVFFESMLPQQCVFHSGRAEESAARLHAYGLGRLDVTCRPLMKGIRSAKNDATGGEASREAAIATPRLLGEIPLTTKSPIRMSPQRMLSDPAAIRKVADLPQPDGRTSETTNLHSILRLIPFSVGRIPKASTTLRRVVRAFCVSSRLLAAPLL